MSSYRDSAADGAELTDDQWHSIEKTLAPGFDHEWFRSELERIAYDNGSPRKLELECWDRVRLCKAFNRALPKMELIGNRDALSQQLALQIQRETKLAKSYAQMAKERMPRKFLRQCRALWAWQSAGGDLGITTRPGRVPEGPVIRYFQAASVVVGGKTPGAWQIKGIVKRYRRMNYTVIGSTSTVTVKETFIPAKTRRAFAP
jgi:hypothetical protein